MRLAYQAHASVHLRNAAGQTFLHILDVTHLVTNDDFSNLLVMLRDLDFHLDARDHCGRSVLLSLLKQQEMFRDPLSLRRFYDGLASEEALWNACFVQDNLGDSAAAHLQRIVSGGISGEPRVVDTIRLLARCLPNCISSVFPQELLSPEGFRARPDICLSRADDTWVKFMVPSTGPHTLHALAETHSLASIPASELLDWRLKRLNHLIRAGLDPNGYDDRGFTPLLAVVHFSDGEEDSDTAELVKHLIANGANVHHRDRGGKNAHSLAVKRGLRVAARVLMERGAKPCAKSEHTDRGL